MIDLIALTFHSHTRSAIMVNVKNLTTLVAVVDLAGDAAAVTADPAVRKSATQASRDVRQAARSVTDLCSETTHAWGRIRAARTGLGPGADYS